MNKKIPSFLFSMSFTGLLLIVFALAIALATFVENAYGTPSARYLVYNARWFELLLALLSVNLIGNIIINQMYRKEKLTLFMFHISFVLILLGAGITRYIGYEGTMHIREKGFANSILGTDMYIHLLARADGYELAKSKKTQFSWFSGKNLKTSFRTPDGKLKVKSEAFIPNAEIEVEASPKGSPALHLVFTSFTGRRDVFLKEGEKEDIFFLTIGFNTKDSCDINITGNEEEGLAIASAYGITRVNMAQSHAGSADTFYHSAFHPMAVFTIQSISLVLARHYPNALLSYKPGYDKDNPDVVKLKLTYGSEEKQMILYGHNGVIGQPIETVIGNVSIRASYGPGSYRIPFSLRLNRFQLDRYPGSSSPSSFASHVTLIDAEKKVSRDLTISMNNILNYRGYRFYQSSYDQDEKGTVLSVNKDLAGTLVTYIGYFLLVVGMILSLFNRNSRLRKLASHSKALLILPLWIAFSAPYAHAGDTLKPSKPVIAYSHARMADGLIVQDNKGRMKPFNTFSSELLRKISRNNDYNGLHPNQVVLGMMVDPSHWQHLPLIRVSNPEVQQILQINEKYAAFVDFFARTGSTNQYILSDLVENAYIKSPGSRSKLDNDLIKADEKLNICYLIFTGHMFRALPIPGEDSHKWYAYPDIPETLMVSDSIQLRKILPAYFTQVSNAMVSGKWDEADEVLSLLIAYQQKHGHEIIPSERKIKMEVFYNEFRIFDRLSGYYGILGFVFLILLFFSELSSGKKFIKINLALTSLGALLFVFHTLGLGVRWYISGHAPWSNGYESMIYISWATVLAGIIFSRKSFFAPAATFILSFIILHVAHMSWLDPEITTLAPVLRSYWLTIHVSVITASYGFLGLTALLAVVNLILMVLSGRNNFTKIGQTIARISSINEMSIIVGLYLLTIGTFLGGIWANESWGRYWGWDPKETWALVTILVYAFIAHMRFIPGLKGKYVFNLFSVIAYGSVIMTYFGVNYYLAGLHSYAKGDPAPLPRWVIYTILSIAVLAIAAYYKNNMLTIKTRVDEKD